MRTILHIDFNSYFATVEQQANPRLRGKPIGVTGGDRDKRTVVGAASVEAKRYGVRTGMNLAEALKLCPSLILVRGDSDKYLECTKRFLNILKGYSPYLEVFSIDEVFLELNKAVKGGGERGAPSSARSVARTSDGAADRQDPERWLAIALEIKRRIRKELGEWITCSIGISYNKFMAKLAGSLYKPDGLVAILDEEAAQSILDQVELDEVCGIGFRIKKRLNNMGVFDFKNLRKIPLEILLASFKSYGQVLFNMSRGIDNSGVVPFYEKEEVKSVGHRHTIDHDTRDPVEIKQILLKLTELISRKLRSKKLVGKTVSCWFRYAFSLDYYQATGQKFAGDGMQCTINLTDDGLDIFNAAWQIFLKMWDQKSIRMIGASISNLRPLTPQNLSLLTETEKIHKITQALDKINDRYGEFTLQRGILLNSANVRRKANSFLADRRFKI